MDKCYANSLGGCSVKISKEHYISEHLLREFGAIKAKGFHWLRGKEKTIGASALTASVLCTTHNSMLSALDNDIVPIFRAFKEAGDTTVKKFKNCRYNVSGKTLELWLLKVLCGMVASGNASTKNQPLDFNLPKEWIDILYGKAEMPARCGLHINCQLKLQYRMEDVIAFGPVFHKGTTDVAGCVLSFGGYPLSLILAPVLADANYMLRPNKLEIKKWSIKETLTFHY